MSALFLETLLVVLVMNILCLICTAWRHIMAHASNWHKTEVKIFNNNSLSPTLAHKEVKLTTEII